MKTFKKEYFVIIGIIIIIMIVGYFTISTTIGRLSIPKRDTLIIGTSTPYPPFEIRYGDTIIGFDIDLIKSVSLKLNREPVIVDYSDFNALIPTLVAGKIDIAIAGISYTEQRDELVDFSKSYYNSSQCIIALTQSNFDTLENPEDFNELRIGYQLDTTSQYWIESNINISNIVIVPFEDMQTGLSYLQFGDVDIIIMDKPVAYNLINTSPYAISIVGEITTTENYCILVQQGDPQGLLPIINATLDEIQQNGKYSELISKWFGEINE
jgi:ABC-type amino acid transport substrate-binding protein